MKSEKLTGVPWQTIYDAALEAYGSLDGLAMILEDNPQVIANANDLDGVKIDVRNAYTDKENVLTIFSKRKPISG